MQKIISLSWKTTIVRFSGRSEILFFIILPVLFTFLLSGGAGAKGEVGEPDTRLPLLVIDEDRSPESAQFLALLQSSTVVNSRLLNGKQAEEAMQESSDPLLIIYAGSGGKLNQGMVVDLALETGNNADGPVIAQTVRAASAAFSRPYLIASLSTAVASQEQAFTDKTQEQAYFQEGLELARALDEKSQARLIETQPTGHAGTDAFDPVAFQSIGQLVTWVFIPLLGLSGLLVYERTNGTLRRLFVTPTRRRTYLTGTLFGQVVLALVQMALLIGFGMLFLDVNWGQSPVALVLLLVCFALAAAGLGTALGAFAKTPGQAANLSIMIGMSCALLGGAWIPMELFPPTVQTAVKLLPTTWAMQGLIDLVIRGQGVVAILPESAVLLTFFALFLFIGVRHFRYE
jgi:ABC-2 type transport system permease protein